VRRSEWKWEKKKVRRLLEVGMWKAEKKEGEKLGRWEGRTGSGKLECGKREKRR
jgi:hypothetical protein